MNLLDIAMSASATFAAAYAVDALIAVYRQHRASRPGGGD